MCSNYWNLDFAWKEYLITLWLILLITHRFSEIFIYRKIDEMKQNYCEILAIDKYTIFQKYLKHTCNFKKVSDNLCMSYTLNLF